MQVMSFLMELLQGISSIVNKIQDVLTYKVDISWLVDLLDFFGADIGDLPSNVSLMGLLLTIGALPLAIVIIYSIFKPWGKYMATILNDIIEFLQLNSMFELLAFCGVGIFILMLIGLIRR